MNSAFERLQKLAEEKRIKEKSEKPRFEIVPVNIDEQPSAPSAVNNSPVAPEKDFAKVANSIVRQIPSGVFVGKSKQMYDYLYSLTRGAVKPTRSIRISKMSLMRGSGIKSTHTFYNNVRHLETIGLINTMRIDGEKGGNSYEIFVPEEIEGGLEHLAQLAHLAQAAHSVQKLLVAPSAVSALGALGSNPISIGVSSIPKTSFKDSNKNDDDYARVREAFSVLTGRLDAAAKKITGKGVSKNEAEKWGTLADLLVLELEVAASRAESVSSIPAFLTEVLRRQFFVSRQTPSLIKLPKAKVDTVGKSDSNSYEIKPLDEKGRAEAIAQLKEFAADDFLQDFKKWYTSEDWAWLTKELGKNSG